MIALRKEMSEDELRDIEEIPGGSAPESSIAKTTATEYEVYPPPRKLVRLIEGIFKPPDGYVYKEGEERWVKKLAYTPTQGELFVKYCAVKQEARRRRWETRILTPKQKVHFKPIQKQVLPSKSPIRYHDTISPLIRNHDTISPLLRYHDTISPFYVPLASNVNLHNGERTQAPVVRFPNLTPTNAGDLTVRKASGIEQWEEVQDDVQTEIAEEYSKLYLEELARWDGSNKADHVAQGVNEKFSANKAVVANSKPAADGERAEDDISEVLTEWEDSLVQSIEDERLSHEQSISINEHYSQDKMPHTNYLLDGQPISQERYSRLPLSWKEKARKKSLLRMTHEEWNAVTATARKPALREEAYAQVADLSNKRAKLLSKGQAMGGVQPAHVRQILKEANRRNKIGPVVPKAAPITTPSLVFKGKPIQYSIYCKMGAPNRKRCRQETRAVWPLQYKELIATEKTPLPPSASIVLHGASTPYNDLISHPKKNRTLAVKESRRTFPERSIAPRKRLPSVPDSASPVSLTSKNISYQGLRRLNGKPLSWVEFMKMPKQDRFNVIGHTLKEVEGQPEKAKRVLDAVRVEVAHLQKRTKESASYSEQKPDWAMDLWGKVVRALENAAVDSQEGAGSDVLGGEHADRARDVERLTKVAMELERPLDRREADMKEAEDHTILEKWLSIRPRGVKGALEYKSPADGEEAETRIESTQVPLGDGSDRAYSRS